MGSIFVIFQFAAVLLALLAICILVWVNNDSSHSKRMLVALLAVVTIMNINGVIYLNKWYLVIPQFHKVLYPFALVIAPISFIYIRSVLFHEFRFRKYDWLIIIPAILLAINLIPYYGMPLAEKKAYLEAYYRDSSIRTQSSNGIMPSYVFPFVRVAWSLVFIFLNYRLINRFTSTATSQILSDNTTSIRWIKALNGMLSLLLLANLFSSFIAPVLQNDFNIPDIALGSLALLICIALFVRPNILYGLYEPVQSLNTTNDVAGMLSPEREEGKAEITIVVEKPPETIQGISISTSDLNSYKLMLEDHFKNNKPFLHPDYTLDLLVNDLKLSRHALSAFINREYNVGFRVFLNRYRVEYMISHLNNPDWAKLTLEAISEQCGFNSRTNFIKNFKEITGQTPSAYIKNLKKNK